MFKMINEDLNAYTKNGNLLKKTKIFSFKSYNTYGNII